MIVGFIGARGSGKTLSMVKEAYIKYKQGYKIFSNIKLSFPYTPYSVDMLLDFAERGTYFDDCVIIIDELHIIIDSRGSGTSKRGKIFSYLINQSSKQDLDIYYSTQYLRQIDVRMRINTEMIIMCSAKCLVYKHKNSKVQLLYNYRPKPSDYKCTTYIKNDITFFSDSGDKRSIKLFKGNPYFKLYNTKEIVKIEKDKYQFLKIPIKQKRLESHNNRIFHEQQSKRFLNE